MSVINDNSSILIDINNSSITNSIGNIAASSEFDNGIGYNDVIVINDDDDDDNNINNVINSDSNDSYDLRQADNDRISNSDVQILNSISLLSNSNNIDELEDLQLYKQRYPIIIIQYHYCHHCHCHDHHYRHKLYYQYCHYLYN